MLFELVLFFTIATALTTLAVMVDHVVRSRAWLGIPVGLVIMATAAWLTGLIAHDPGASLVLPIIAIVATALVRALLRRWSILAGQLLAMVLLASIAYLVYAALLPFIDRLSPLGVTASLVLLLLELAALTLSVYYVFEILDVFSRRTRVAHVPDTSYRAKVAIQVPCYNEPIEVMRETLTALAKLRYPDVIVQVVDNNTKDEKAWRALQQLCQELGPRFQFIHLEPWPGYKAGALNEATRRMLGSGGIGVFEPTAFGEGLMPLTFDGLKKQRFRWALGGIQILRRQWKELIPFAPHRLRLTWGQRLDYLFGSVHWFGDLLTVLFTALLLLTALAAVLHHRLPIREITGAVLIVPLAFLLTGVLRGLWALRRAEGSTWGDAFRAMGVWFALSWVDTLAVLRGLVSGRAAFLRTPKQREGGNRIWPAIRSSAMESLLAALAVLGAIVMLLAAPAIATAILAAMLLFEAWIFGSAAWASFAAEGIQLTPYRQIYRRSAQNTGERPQRASRSDLVPALLAAAVAVVLAYGLLNAPAENPAPTAQLPTFGTITHILPSTGPAPTATAAPTAIPTPSATASPSASATASASPP